MIDNKLGQQIVATVKDVSGRDINFINPAGIIFASTDEKRIGSFHEIGQRAATTGETIEVETDHSFSGTQKGVNLPIYYKNNIIAVIGISGPPEDVRKYAYLAQRITSLLIRERELTATGHTQAEKKHYIINTLITRTDYNHDFLSDALKSFDFNYNEPVRMVVIRLNSKYNLINISMIEQMINQQFQYLGISLFTYYYPNEYLAVVKDSQYQKIAKKIAAFAASNQKLIDIAIGKTTDVFQLDTSYESSKIAFRSIQQSELNHVLFDDLTLELVLSSINSDSKEAFLNKTTARLDAEDIQLISTYFETDMSLQKTCDQLFVHKNTVQYQLDRIDRKCGYNPRKFKDAAILYLAVKLQYN